MLFYAAALQTLNYDWDTLRRTRPEDYTARMASRVAPRIVRIYTLRGFESVLAGSVQVSTGTKTSLSFQDGPVFTRVHRREGVTSRNGKNRTLRPIERRAGPELALFNLLVQPPAMVQNIVDKELDRLGHARVGVPGSGRSCSPKRSRCGDRAWRSPEPSLSGKTL